LFLEDVLRKGWWWWVVVFCGDGLVKVGDGRSLYSFQTMLSYLILW
jgi:hypothetical protein